MVIVRVLPEQTAAGRLNTTMRRSVRLGQLRAGNGNITPALKAHVIGESGTWTMCGRSTDRMRRFRGWYSQITCRRCLRNDWFDLTALG